MTLLFCRCTSVRSWWPRLWVLLWKQLAASESFLWWPLGAPFLDSSPLASWLFTQPQTAGERESNTSQKIKRRNESTLMCLWPLEAFMHFNVSNINLSLNYDWKKHLLVNPSGIKPRGFIWSQFIVLVFKVKQNGLTFVVYLWSTGMGTRLKLQKNGLWRNWWIPSAVRWLLS